jgi:hypothetical protein
MIASPKQAARALDNNFNAKAGEENLLLQSWAWGRLGSQAAMQDIKLRERERICLLCSTPESALACPLISV